jgi:hypothetical protein
VFVKLWRGEVPGDHSPAAGRVLAATAFVVWAAQYVPPRPVIDPAASHWLATWSGIAECAFEANLWEGAYPLSCTVHRTLGRTIDPNSPDLLRQASAPSALVIQPDGRPVSENSMPIGVTNLRRVIPTPAVHAIQAPSGSIPFTLEYTGYPVLRLKDPNAPQATPAATVAALVPILQGFQEYVDNQPTDAQLFSPIFREVGVRSGPAPLSDAARSSANKLLSLCSAAGQRAVSAAADELRQRRLEQPLITAQECLAMDPDCFPAYAWAAILHLRLGHTSLAFDFFLTLYLRMRVAERILAPAAPANPQPPDRERLRLAVRSRLDPAFWKLFAQLAEELQLRGRMDLNFPLLTRFAATS